MKPGSKVMLSVALALVFFGCATLSKNECLQADWYELGYRDGSVGAPRSLFQNHYDACLEHNVHADRAAYFEGRDEGLSAYCTYDSGFTQGRAGHIYKRVCPPELEPGFRAGYNKGNEIYQFESQIASLEYRLTIIEKKIHGKEEQLVSPDLSYPKRKKIRADIRDLDIEYRDVARKLRDMERMKPVMQWSDGSHLELGMMIWANIPKGIGLRDKKEFYCTILYNKKGNP
jgi:hypothetical protein